MVKLAVDPFRVEPLVPHAVRVELVGGLVKGESGVGQSLPEVYHVRAVDIAGSRASGDEVIGCHAEQGYL